MPAPFLPHINIRNSQGTTTTTASLTSLEPKPQPPQVTIATSDTTSSSILTQKQAVSTAMAPPPGESILAQSLPPSSLSLPTPAVGSNHLTSTTSTTEALIAATPVSGEGEGVPIVRPTPTRRILQPSTVSSSTATATVSSGRPSQHHRMIHADTGNLHQHWSGFYRKTLKERRTQLGLAFPHLTHPSPLESFASTSNSTKTSGQSTPNFGPTRAHNAALSSGNNNVAQPPPSVGTSTAAGTTAPLPHQQQQQHYYQQEKTSSQSGSTTTSIWMNSIIDPPASAAVATAPVHNIPIASVMKTSRSVTSLPSLVSTANMSATAVPDHRTQPVLDHHASAATPTRVIHSPIPVSKILSNNMLPPLLSRPESPAFSTHHQHQQRHNSIATIAPGPMVPIHDGQGLDQRINALIEKDYEKRVQQIEKERQPTKIVDLSEQRKMIGSPNGSLLEGDLSLDARLDAIASEQDGCPFPVHGLDEGVANNMVENCIGTLGLPIGVAFNFTINGQPLVIPMAIEEPSVIAAVSSAAKTISTYYGFKAFAPERNMIIAQVQILDIGASRMEAVLKLLNERHEDIKQEANAYCPNMVLRGGGVQKITFHRIKRREQKLAFKGQDLLVKYGVVNAGLTAVKHLGDKGQQQDRCTEWLVAHLHIDVGDAMGANCANTVAEGIAPVLADLTGGRIGVRILSNLNVDRIAKSTFRLPFSHMGYKNLAGADVAVRMLEAFEWADLDPYRAATHNKGIMNGIDAVAVATGQDWRAIEAGAHAWAGGAAKSDWVKDDFDLDQSLASFSLSSDPNGNGFSASSSSTDEFVESCYRPLTRYWIEEDQERIDQGFEGADRLVFCGELEMPIMVGTKGGVLSTNPIHAFTLGVMRYPDSKQLAMAMVTVGLAQNFAAMRALATEGIQRGHMALHARNIAISAGTPASNVEEVAAHMVETGVVRLAAAKSYLEKRGIRSTLQMSRPATPSLAFY